jgi:hypothetical protein
MRTAYVVATLISIAAGPLHAMDSHIVGPRALGMGGTGTAAADDHTAAYYNPGLYGFFSRTGEEDERLPADPNFIGRKDWGIGLIDASFQVEIRGQLANLIEVGSTIDLGKVSTLGVTNPSKDDLKAVMATLALIENFVPNNDTVTFSADAGAMNMRIGHFGIGVRMFSEGVASLADLDRLRVGVGTGSGVDIGQVINNSSVTPSGWTSGYQNLITGTAYANLDAALQAKGVSSTDSQDAISKLDYAATQAGLTQANIDAMAATGGTLLNAIVESTNVANSFDENTTAAFSAGFALVEVPLTYGHAINDNLSFGGSVKLMVGQVAAAKVRLVSDNSDMAAILQDSLKDSKQTVTAGVDLGMALRNSWAQIGLTARNINSPVLKGGVYTDADGGEFEVDDVTLDPQVSIGLALYPWETVCLTADMDLLENSTVFKTTNRSSLPAGVDRTLKVEYATQRVGGGIEWNVLRFLALRGGASTDLAESEMGTMIHAGVGLNLWAMRFDLAGAVSTEKISVDGTDYPRAANASIGITIDF